MPLVSQSSPIVIQPIVAALKSFQTGVINWGKANGFDTDTGTTSSQYVSYAQLTALTQLLVDLYNEPQTKNTVQVKGGSLYQLAALYYADVLQAFTLMQVNGLWTPWLDTQNVETITIPQAQTATPATGFGPIAQGTL